MKTENQIKTVQTRHNEVLLLAKTPEDMFGMYAAENIYHVWNEDFKDQDSGEIVSVERKQLLFERGTYFDNRNIDTVRFHFDAGELTEALVSNQCRIGNEIDHWGLQAYKVKVSINGKNNVFVCQARSLTMAHEIVKDWCELHLEKPFLIVSITELSTGIILNAALKKREEVAENSAEVSTEASEISEKAEEVAEEPLPSLEEEAAPDPNDDVDLGGEELEAAASKKSSSGYYEVQLEIHYQYNDRDLKHTDIKSFLVEAKDADAARDACFGYIDMTREDNESVEEIRIISASPFSCYKVIEREFTAAYIDAERNAAEQKKSNE